MAKREKTFTMAEVVKKWKTNKLMIKVFGGIFFLFPFVPPYFLYYDKMYLTSFSFDPRDPNQIPYFFAYLTVYYVIFLGILSKIADNNSKRKKLIIDKSILLGCPVDVRRLSEGKSNSFKTTVCINQDMLTALEAVGSHEKPKQQSEEMAMAEPFAMKIVIASGTAGKFLESTIPHYHRARKIGDTP